MPPVIVPSNERVGLELEFDCTARVASSTLKNINNIIEHLNWYDY